MGQNTIWELGIQIVKHGGTFLQLEKANPKMGFILRAKQGLRKYGFKDQIGLIWGGEKREGEGEEKRKRKKKKRRRGRGDQAKKVWKLTLLMNSM